MISRIHESLSNTTDCIEMAGGFFASEKTAGVEAGSPRVVFYFPELEKILAQFEKPGEEITRETFEFLAATSLPCGLINSNCRFFPELLIQRLLIKIGSAIKPRLFHSHAKNWLCRSS